MPLWSIFSTPPPGERGASPETTLDCGAFLGCDRRIPGTAVPGVRLARRGGEQLC